MLCSVQILPTKDSRTKLVCTTYPLCSYGMLNALNNKRLRQPEHGSGCPAQPLFAAKTGRCLAWFGFEHKSSNTGLYWRSHWLCQWYQQWNRRISGFRNRKFSSCWWHIVGVGRRRFFSCKSFSWISVNSVLIPILFEIRQECFSSIQMSIGNELSKLLMILRKLSPTAANGMCEIASYSP